MSTNFRLDLIEPSAREVFIWTLFEREERGASSNILARSALMISNIFALRWEFIKENKKTRFRPRKLSIKKEKKKKETRPRQRKRPRKKKKTFSFS